MPRTHEQTWAECPEVIQALLIEYRDDADISEDIRTVLVPYGLGPVPGEPVGGEPRWVFPPDVREFLTKQAADAGV